MRAIPAVAGATSILFTTAAFAPEHRYQSETQSTASAALMEDREGSADAIRKLLSQAEALKRPRIPEIVQSIDIPALQNLNGTPVLFTLLTDVANNCEEQEGTLTLRNINGNIHIHIEVNGKTYAFTYTPPSAYKKTFNIANFQSMELNPKEKTFQATNAMGTVGKIGESPILTALRQIIEQRERNEIRIVFPLETVTSFEPGKDDTRANLIVDALSLGDEIAYQVSNLLARFRQAKTPKVQASISQASQPPVPPIKTDEIVLVFKKHDGVSLAHY